MRSANLKLTEVRGDFRLGNEDYLTMSEFYNVVKTVPLALKLNQKFPNEISGIALLLSLNRQLFHSRS
jgi:hypothetical protein